MSGEDDTFDIDLYGNEDEQQDLYGQDGSGGGADEYNEHPNAEGQVKNESGGGMDEEIDFDDPPAESVEQKLSTTGDQAQSTSEAQKQGTKRKAPSDEEEQQPQKTRSASTQPIDPNATPALKLSELNWWTTEEDLRGFCAKAGTESDLRDLSFGEHKINGKAKGEAYLEFGSPSAASRTKNEIEQQGKGEGEGVKKVPYQVWFSGLGNPFRNAKDAGGAVGAARKDFNAQQPGGRGGAYNNFNNRGNFGGRGNFNQNRGGGYGNNNFQNRMGGQQQQQGGWGMNGGFGAGAGAGGYGMGGFGNMQGIYNPAMMMQNMQGMMGRGGFGGGMGMGNMGGMGGMRGGGNMMGRGGWGGGGNFGQGGGGMMGGGYGGGGGFGQGQQGQQNKRPRME